MPRLRALRARDAGRARRGAAAVRADARRRATRRLRGPQRPPVCRTGRQGARQALGDAGIDRRAAYLTNVVKHFKWQERGRRRIHQKPSWGEITACRPWLDAELAVVAPRVLVCLGATAAQALLGRQFRVTRHRGDLLESDLAEVVTATVHPSSILRAPDEAARRAELEAFVDDLRVVASLLS